MLKVDIVLTVLETSTEMPCCWKKRCNEIGSGFDADPVPSSTTSDAQKKQELGGKSSIDETQARRGSKFPENRESAV
jgi:hypothetical protein